MSDAKDWADMDKKMQAELNREPLEPCPACEEGLLHPDNWRATAWTCDSCGFGQQDEAPE